MRLCTIPAGQWVLAVHQTSIPKPPMPPLSQVWAAGSGQAPHLQVLDAELLPGREGLVVEGLAGVAAPMVQVPVQPQPKSTAGKVPTAQWADGPLFCLLRAWRCPQTSHGTSHLPVPTPRCPPAEDGQRMGKRGTGMKSSCPQDCHPAAGSRVRAGMAGAAGQPPLVLLASDQRCVPRPSSTGQPGLTSWPQPPSRLGTPWAAKAASAAPTCPHRAPAGPHPLS